MQDRLISRMDAAKRLGLSPGTFSRYKAKLIAMGLRPVRLGQHEKFLESSIDHLIQQLSKHGGLRDDRVNFKSDQY